MLRTANYTIISVLPWLSMVLLDELLDMIILNCNFILNKILKHSHDWPPHETSLKPCMHAIHVQCRPMYGFLYVCVPVYMYVEITSNVCTPASMMYIGGHV